MKLSTISIRNFRSIRALDLALRDYSCFLGKNDTGKSSVLDALNLLFDPSMDCRQQDICGIEVAEEDEAYIEGKLEDVPETHPYSASGVARVRFDLRDERRYAWGVTATNHDLKAMGTGIFTKGQYTKAALSDEQRTLVDPIIANFPASGSRIEAQGWVHAYEALDNEGLVDKEPGWDPITDGDLVALVVPVILRADLKALEELSDAGDTALARVGGFLVRQAASQHKGLQEANENLKTQIADVSRRDENGRWEFEPLNQLEDTLEAEIQDFDSAVIVDAMVAPPKLRPLQFSIQVGVHDKYVPDISGLGHGLQRTAIFALLRIPQKLASAEPAPESPLYLFLIEEPELFLHPQAELRRMRDLTDLSLLPQVQVCVATHSAFFVDMWLYRGIARFSRPNRLATIAQQWEGKELDDDLKELLKAARFFHPTRSAMLFADMVVLTEGDTENLMIPVLAEGMGIIADNVEVVNCTGIGNLKLFSQILQGFKMKYIVWPDSNETDKIEDLRKNIDPAFGKLVIANGNWETMTEITVSKRDSKPLKSYEHFVVNGNEPNELTRACIRAAYEWRDFDASAADN
ncbi:MAG: ATP-dependent nuclease [Fimbriimonadales bacterium]